MLNQIVLTGNLGQDPEIFFTSKGDPIVKFSLAFKTSKKVTSWIKVSCFGRLAEIVSKHLHQGARVGVIGVLDENRWENEQGEKKRSFQVNCHNIEIIKSDGRGWESDGNDHQN